MFIVTEYAALMVKITAAELLLETTRFFIYLFIFYLYNISRGLHF